MICAPVDSSSRSSTIGSIYAGRPTQHPTRCFIPVDGVALRRASLPIDSPRGGYLVRQLLIYATGAPIRFGDRPEVERILEQAEADEYGVRSLIRGVAQSELFLTK